MKEWYKLSILEVAALYRRKELSPVEVVHEIFRRLDKLEPKLNAFITILKDEAMESAKKAEGIFFRNEPAPILCGIPFTIKDIFDTKAIKTTCGSKILHDHIPAVTAPIVDYLIGRGAILIGKTNMLEFAYGNVHPDYGQTNNPWDFTKTAGGSSGGSAASIAAGLGLFSLGSDTGGSIRIPASYCGIAGLKPTYGLLSLEGVFPLSPSLDHAGPLAKSAEDLLVVMDELILSCQKEKENDKSKHVAGILPSEVFVDLDEDVRRVYLEVLSQLKIIGWDVEEIGLKYFHRAEEIIMNVLLPEAALIHQPWIHRKSDYAPLTWKQIEAGLDHHSVDYLMARQESAEVRKDIDHFLEKVDCLVMPTVPYPAPEVDPALEDDHEMKFTGLFNISGHPAVTIQAGFSKEKLPIGIQLIGKHHEDRRLLEQAIKLEEQVSHLMKGKWANV